HIHSLSLHDALPIYMLLTMLVTCVNSESASTTDYGWSMSGTETRRGRSGGRRPTSKDVAAAAGVSRSAVSFAFNDPGRISEATRERILGIAQEMGYTPNPLARMLKAGQTQSLGVLLPQALARTMENP